MKSSGLLSIKTRVLLIVLVLVAGAWFASYQAAMQTVREEQARHAAEAVDTVVHAARQELNSSLRARVKDLVPAIARAQASKFVDKSHGSSPKSSSTPFINSAEFFKQLPDRARAETLAVTFVPRTDPDGKASTLVNEGLIKELGLPEGVLEQVQTSKPLLPEDLGTGAEIRLVNRTIRLEDDSPLTVLSLVFFERDSPSAGPGRCLVVDLVADAFQQKLGGSESFEIFFVNDQGHVVLSSSSEKMADFAATKIAHPATENLAAQEAASKKFEWQQAGVNLLAMRIPVGIAGLFAVAQLKAYPLQQAMGTYAQRSGVLLLTVFCVGLLLLWWINLRLEKDFAQLRSVVNGLLEGQSSLWVKISVSAESQILANMLKRTEEKMADFKTQAIESGRRESGVVLEQALRKGDKSEPTIDCETFGLCGFKSHEVQQPGLFWDYAHHGDKIVLVMGRAKSVGAVSPLVTSVVRAALELMRSETSIHALAQKMTLAERLGVVNRVLATVFQGTECLEACALELDLTTGKIAFVQAGHSFTLFRRALTRSSGNSGTQFIPGAEKLKTVAVESALGSEIGTQYRLESSQLQPGDSILFFIEKNSKEVSVETLLQDEFRTLFSKSDLSQLLQTQNQLMLHVNSSDEYRDQVIFFLLNWKVSAAHIHSERVLAAA